MGHLIHYSHRHVLPVDNGFRAVQVYAFDVFPWEKGDGGIIVRLLNYSPSVPIHFFRAFIYSSQLVDVIISDFPQMPTEPVLNILAEIV